ncbi:hypothetical protein ACFX2J_025384 [Malus domestica]
MNQLDQDAGELLESPYPLPMESLLSTIILLPINSPLAQQKRDLLQHCSFQFTDALSLKLSQISSTSHYPRIRRKSLKLLYDLLTDPAVPQISLMTLNGLKSPLLSSFRPKTGQPMSQIMPEIVAIVASRIFSDSDQLWEELLDYVYVSITGSNVTQEVQEMGFRVLSNLPENLLNRLMPGFDFLWAKILHRLRDSSDLDSWAAAIQAASRFLKILPYFLGAARLGMAMSTAVNSTHNLATKVDPRNATVTQRFLEFITQMVTKTQPRLLFDRLNYVLESMLMIAESAVATVIREGAIRVLKKIDESNRRIMSRQLERLDRVNLDGFFCSLMRVLVGAANVEKNKSTVLAKYFMDRLSTMHGGKIFARHVRNQIGVFAVAQEWQKRHAGLVTICATADACEEVMRNHVEELATIVVDGLKDPHSQVRCAATDAIKALSVNLAPTLHEHYHRRILLLLTKMLKEKKDTVWGKAIDAIRFFSNGCTPDNLEPYLPRLVEALLAHLKNGNTTLQWGVLAALGVLASSSENRFDIYYRHTMDAIKLILFGVANASTKLLHAHCLGCISYIAIVVGKDTFANDADEVMGALISLQGFLLETDHMLKVSIFQVLAKLCRLLGDDFLIYVDDLMPSLIQSAQTKINKEVNRREKALACKLLFCFTRQFKGNFLPWIKQVTPVLRPLLHSDLHFETRMEAISAMPVLLRLAISQEVILEDIQEELIYFITALVRNLEENDAEISARVLNSLKECIKVSGRVLTNIHVKFVVDGILKILNENSSENEIQEAEGFEIGPQEETRNRGDGHTVNAKIVVFLFNYFVQQSQEPASKYCSIFLPFLLRACKDHDPCVRQQAVRGIGTCAEFGINEFKPFAEEAAKSLDSVIRHPGTSSSNNPTAHVIAVSSLGRICGSYFKSINAPQFVGKWLDFLPLKNDTTEAKLVHARLSAMIEEFHDILLGVNSQYKSRILEIFAQVVADGDNLATKETVNRMVVQLVQSSKP